MQQQRVASCLVVLTSHLGASTPPRARAHTNTNTVCRLLLLPRRLSAAFSGTNLQYQYLSLTLVGALPLTLAVDGTDWAVGFGTWDAGNWAELVTGGTVIYVGQNYLLQVRSYRAQRLPFWGFEATPATLVLWVADNILQAVCGCRVRRDYTHARLAQGRICCLAPLLIHRGQACLGCRQARCCVQGQGLCTAGRAPFSCGLAHRSQSRPPCPPACSTPPGSWAPPWCPCCMASG